MWIIFTLFDGTFKHSIINSKCPIPPVTPLSFRHELTCFGNGPKPIPIITKINMKFYSNFVLIPKPIRQSAYPNENETHFFSVIDQVFTCLAQFDKLTIPAFFKAWSCTWYFVGTSTQQIRFLA